MPHKVKIELKVVKHWDTFKPTGLVPRVKVECNLKVMRAGARRGISWKVILLLALSRLLQVKVNIPPNLLWVMFQPIFGVAILLYML